MFAVRLEPRWRCGTLPHLPVSGSPHDWKRGDAELTSDALASGLKERPANLARPGT